LVEGVDWFREESLGEGDIARVEELGRKRVLLSHDAPSGWEIPGLPDPKNWPVVMQAELGAAHAHRARLREAYESVQPELLIHGHYHSGYEIVVAEAWGDVRVSGLDRDYARASLGVLSSAGGEVTFERLVG